MAYGKKSMAVKPYQKKKQGATKIAQKALKIAKQNRSYAAIDFSISDTMTGSNTPEVLFLSPSTAEGGGDRITIQDIEVFVRIIKNTAVDAIVHWRIDLVLDRTPAKVVLSTTDLYESSNPDVAALMSFDNRERYKLCKSYHGYFDNDVSVSKHIHFKYRSGLVCEADGGIFGQSKILKNAYYLVYWTDVTSNFPTMVGNCRITSLLT